MRQSDVYLIVTIHTVCRMSAICRAIKHFKNININNLWQQDLLSSIYAHVIVLKTNRRFGLDIGCRHCQSCGFGQNITRRFIHLSKWMRMSKKMSKQSTTQNLGSDVESDEEEVEVDLLSNIEEENATVPTNYKHMIVHTFRADKIVAKGLNLSSSEVEELFYSSKFLLDGTTLTKKAKKLQEGDYIDVVQSQGKDDDSPAMVLRVKVLKVFKKTTKDGNPYVGIRVWKKPFPVPS